MFVAAVCHAQGGPPNGTWHTTIDSVSNRVWDVSGVSDITDAEVSAHNSDTDVSFEFTTDPLNQDGRGKISAAGSASVLLTIEDQNGPSRQSFTGNYAVKGSIKGGKSAARGTLTQTVSGMADVEGVRKVKATHKVQFMIDAVAGTLTSTETETVSAAGKGSITNHKDAETHALSDDFSGNGSWTLDMALATTNTTVTGTATVTLDSGRVFHYTVKGKYNTAKNNWRLTLKGIDDAKGSTLQVLGQDLDLLLIKGKISGQAVNAANP